jgi:phosphate transport system protein
LGEKVLIVEDEPAPADRQQRNLGLQTNGGHALVKPMVDLPLMAAKAGEMLHDALAAFVRRDAARAQAIPARDDEVDALYEQVYRELLGLVIEDARKMDQANYLLWAAHNLERAADRVTNICERVVFMVTGEMTELDREGNGFEGLS